MANKWELEPRAPWANRIVVLKCDGVAVADIPGHLPEIAIEITRKLNVHDELVDALKLQVQLLAKISEFMVRKGMSGTPAATGRQELLELIARAEGRE